MRLPKRCESITPEFLSGEFVAWLDLSDDDPLYPARRAEPERLHRALQRPIGRTARPVLFRNLAEVREATYWWMIATTSSGPRFAGDLTPAEYMLRTPKTLLSNCLLDREAYVGVLVMEFSYPVIASAAG